MKSTVALLSCLLPLLLASAVRAEPQDLTPVRQIEMYLDGFHNYKREVGLPPAKQSQLRVAHYCSHYSPELIQCVLYDGNGKGARLIGVEYVVPEAVYRGLPAAERKYWHPHDGEVDSGMLVLPGLPADQQKAVLATVRKTWGKTWHVWDYRQDKLPFGEPRLMWPVAPGQQSETTRKAMQERARNPAF
ncbi:MAG: hypothetical protein JWM80_2689 [Cyanobacteria bacterium RYN_339]|nr:hypothetical protein [Cyanobacteria bacterium RYN_339]